MTQIEPRHCGKIVSEFCSALGSSFGPFRLPFGTPQTAPKSPTALLSCILVASAPVWEAIAVSPSPSATSICFHFGSSECSKSCSKLVQKKNQIWLAFGSHFGSILAPFWLHFGSQNRTRNCVEFTSTFLPLSGALLGLRGVHFGSARGPLWALWSPPWPP